MRSAEVIIGVVLTVTTTLIENTSANILNGPQTRKSYQGQIYIPPTSTFSAFSFPEIPTIAAQAVSGLTTYFSLIAYFDRPRGGLVIDQPNVQVKQSQVDGADLGLYATQPMSEGTILGTYPGVVRPAHKYMQKFEKVPSVCVYAWRFTDNKSYIDPTDQNGNLMEYCLGGSDDFPLSFVIHENLLQWKKTTLLARINEPPIGGRGCNVRSEENLKTREVLFSLSKDVVAGEELFMDYGLTYDRSGYS